MSRSLDPRAFDELSQRIAAAYASGDQRTARRLGDLACAAALFPRFALLSRVRCYARELAEDVTAHAYMRVAHDWSRGKAVTWASLETIYVRAAQDVTDRDRKVPVAHLADDDPDAREAFLARHAVGPSHHPDAADAVVAKVRIDQLAAELERLDRPRLATYVRAWHEGYRSGPDVEHRTGIKSGRARQLKMDVCEYVRAFHPDLAGYFDCAGGAAS